jgi:hypothetical protein
MTPQDDLMEYRVEQLEKAVGELSAAVADIKDFLLTIRVWVKGLAVVWTLAQAAIIALIVAFITGAVGQ